MNASRRTEKMGLRFAILLAALLCTAIATAEDKLVVGGSGSVTDEIDDMAKAFMGKNPGEAVGGPPQSMSNTRGLQDVLDGRFSLCFGAPPGYEREKKRDFF